MKAKILLLLLGLVIGLGAAVLLPRLREQLTPSGLRHAPTEGTVEEKRLEADRLLLTLVTPDGAVLATFTQKVPEIDLLVAPGDTVSLALDGYRPFVDDPEIERVVKAPPAEAAPQPAAADSANDARPDDPVEPPAEEPADDEPAAEEPAALEGESEIETEAGSAAEPSAEPPAGTGG